MATEKVVRVTCDRCGRLTSAEPVENAPDHADKKFPYLALGGTLIPELLAEVNKIKDGDKMPPPNATLDDVCTDCQKRIRDLVKSILYYRFKPEKPTAATVAASEVEAEAKKPDGDNPEVPDDTGTVQTEAPRATRSKRSNPSHAEE